MNQPITVVEETPAPSSLPRPASQPRQMSPARSLIPTPEGTCVVLLPRSLKPGCILDKSPTNSIFLLLLHSHVLSRVHKYLLPSLSHLRSLFLLSFFERALPVLSFILVEIFVGKLRPLLIIFDSL